MAASKRDEIWNRAALENGGSNPLEGDRYLGALLRAHGMVMNGGVEHAVEALTQSGLQDAVAAFRFFDLNDAAGLLELASTVRAFDQTVHDEQYARIIPDDSLLFDRFVAKLEQFPVLFAPV